MPRSAGPSSPAARIFSLQFISQKSLVDPSPGSLVLHQHRWTPSSTSINQGALVGADCSDLHMDPRTKGTAETGLRGHRRRGVRLHVQHHQRVVLPVLPNRHRRTAQADALVRSQAALYVRPGKTKNSRIVHDGGRRHKSRSCEVSANRYGVYCRSLVCLSGDQRWFEYDSATQKIPLV